MERTIQLHLDLSLAYGPRTMRVPLIALMLFAGAGELSSESVTLATYYPAPSGVYTNMITTGNTFVARDGGVVTVGATTALSKMAVKGALAVGTYADTVAAPANGLIVSGRLGVGTATPSQALEVAGSIRINAVGCAASDVTAGAVCTGTQYATFTPGFYVEGWSYQNRGGQVLVESGAGQVSTQVRGLDPATGNEGWMTLKKNDSVARIYCCPR